MGNSNYIVTENTDNRFVFRRRLTGYANEILIAIALFVILLSFLSEYDYFDSAPIELIGIVFFTVFAILLINTNSKGSSEYIFDKTIDIFSWKGVKICELDDLKRIEMYEKISYTGGEKDEAGLYYYAILEYGKGEEFIFDETRDYQNLLSICDEISRFANIRKEIVVKKNMHGK